MTAYTSTQSGDFNAVATWGGSGYPSSSADSFTIADGHIVDYNVTSAIATGFGISTINNGGELSFDSGDRSIRFANNFIIYGNLTMGAGHTIYMNGATGTRIQFRGGSAALGCRIEMVGSDPMPVTTSSAVTTGGAGYITATSATQFSAGDWIHVFNREQTNVTDEREDESFRITEVSGSNLYLREFVGPDATISSVSGSTITVDDASVFRVGQYLIFGTGATRNIKAITAKNNTTNVITFGSAVTGVPTGTVYTTGPVKSHKSGSTIRKMATTVAVEATSSATAVTVTDASLYEIGDIVVMENTDTTTNDEFPISREVTNKVGDVLTLDGSFGYTVRVGAFVIKLNRDCQIINENYTTYYWYSNTGASWQNYLEIKDVEFKNIRSTTSNGRCYWFGYYRDDLDADGAQVEGLSIWNEDTFTGSYMEHRFSRYLHRWTVRCMTAHNQHYVSMDTGYDCDDIGFFANWCGRMESYGLLLNQLDGLHHEVAYNRVVGADDSGIMYLTVRATGKGMHHNSVLNSRRRAMDSYSNYATASIYQNEFINYADRMLVAYPMNNVLMYYNKWERSVSLNDFYSFNYAGNVRAGAAATGIVNSIDHNYVEDALEIFFSGGNAQWDNTTHSYKCLFDDDAATYYGLPNTVWIPTDATLSVRGILKLADGYNGAAPILILTEMIDPYYSGASDGTQESDSKGYGSQSIVTFDEDLIGWQSKHTTLASKPFGRYVNVAVVNNNINGSEGWYLKRLDITIDSSVMQHASSNLNKLTGPTTVKYRDANSPKFRLGGRIA